MELGLLRLAIALYLAGTVAALVGIAVRQDLPRTLLPRLLWAGFVAHGLSIAVRSWTAGHLAATTFDEALSVLALLLLSVLLAVLVLGAEARPLARHLGHLRGAPPGTHDGRLARALGGDAHHRGLRGDRPLAGGRERARAREPRQGILSHGARHRPGRAQPPHRAGRGARAGGVRERAPRALAPPADRGRGRGRGRHPLHLQPGGGGGVRTRSRGPRRRAARLPRGRPRRARARARRAPLHPRGP